MATFLSAITVMVFLDFVDRRLTAPDSRVGILLARLLGLDADTGAMELFQGVVAPILSSGVGMGVLLFGVASARSPRGQQLRWDRRTVAIASGIGGIIVALAWLMAWQRLGVDEYGVERPLRVFPSKYFYILLYLMVALPWAYRLVKHREDGWMTRLVALAAAGLTLALFALAYFPDEYSWSKELSLIMLLWVGFLGASICAHEGKHIRMEAASRLVPSRWERHVAALGHLATAAFCGAMAYLGYHAVRGSIAMGGIFEQTGIPDWMATVAIPVAFALTFIRFIAAAVSAWLGGAYGAARDDELAAARKAAVAAATPADPSMGSAGSGSKAPQ